MDSRRVLRGGPREDRFGTARLVRLEVARLPEGAELPSLEAFAEEAGLEDESQAEQIQAYEARYGRAAQRLARRGHLIQRQLEALRWLEGLLAQTPRAGDAVASWLNPSLAAHIEQAGLFTLAQLIDHINGIGKLWHGSIPALGTAKAGLVVAWLGEHQASLGRAVGRHIVRARTELMRSELDAVVAPASDSARSRNSSCPPSSTAGTARTAGPRRNACSRRATTTRRSWRGSSPSTG